MHVTDHVHTLPITIERGDATRTYTPTAVETDHGLVLLDTGFGHTVDQLRDGLDEAGHSLADVSIVLLTHQDGDHAGGLSAVVDEVDPLVVAHAEATPYVDGRKHPIKSEEGGRYPPVPVDVELADGETFRTAAGPMRVVFTPGHAPGHVSLYLPDERLLIAGDALTADEAIAGPNPRFTPDMPRAAESVERLADLDVERAVCYHGGVVDATSDEIAAIARDLQE